ncbi:eukaryotic translation initiation factor 2B subunit delta isoform X2 [Xylocopa sonorina]|uniref:eukaryotic translation initiation factor 2B subunit delta isoform X2 n=1 Tax=Xylocopa sonorina TaxID=1818115 RepID=UPI00403AE17A
MSVNLEPKLFTRSTARHLRRKRLHDARRAEKQQEYSVNDINAKSNEKSVAEKNSDQTEVLTKSKARRLRKKNKAKQNCCSFCKSVTDFIIKTKYCTSPSLIIEEIPNQEVVVEKDTEDVTTLTKSNAVVGLDQDTEREEESNIGVESVTINSYLNKELENRTELKLFSDADIKRAIASSVNELLKNLDIDDSPEINALHSSITDNAELSSSSTDVKDKNSSVDTKEITSGSSAEEQSEVRLVSNSSPIITQYSSINLDSVEKEVEATEAKVSPAESTDRLANETPLFTEDSSIGGPIVAPIKMTNNNKGTVSEKSREEIKAEREAKKAAKALAKAKAKSGKTQDKDAADDKSLPSESIKSKQNNERSDIRIKINVEPFSKAPIVNNTADTRVQNTAPVVVNEKKSKADLRADRRAKQEAQRALKKQCRTENIKVGGPEEDNSSKPVTRTANVTETVKKEVGTPKKIVQKDGKNNTHEINLFKHLYHKKEQTIVDVPFVNSNVHPAIIKLGTQYASKVIVGSNARCVAFLAAVKELIRDFERPSQADFIRGLEASLKESVTYLHHCRPPAVSMQNALRHLKWQMTQLPPMLSDADAKNKLNNAIDTYIREQIKLADEAISIKIQTKISNGDVILTYGYSSLILKILREAHDADKQFRVIVVDGRPWLEGKEQLKRLAQHGIECSYILINALSYIMPEVSKVFLGAHAILANGAVMSRVGTAQVALMARAFNIPVLVACETHKSCERVQTDSIVYNELGNADELAQDYGNGARKSLLANWKTRKSLNLLNITYDVTPADLVTAVVTELAILPCTSVPVILRIKPSEI